MTTHTIIRNGIFEHGPMARRIAARAAPERGSHPDWQSL